MPKTNAAEDKERVISTRPTAIMQQQIDALVAWGYGTVSDVIRTAVDRLYVAETVNRGGAAYEERYLVRQDIGNGDMFFVRLVGGRTYGATGPLSKADYEAIIGGRYAVKEWDPILGTYVQDNADHFETIADVPG